MNEKDPEIISKIITPALPLYDVGFPVIFFWSPKSGCTSLIKWYFFQLGLLQKALEYNPWVHYYRMDIYEKQENYMQKIKEQLMNGEKDIYKQVRNPYNRAVSSFFALFANQNMMDQVFPMGKPDDLTFKQFLYQVKNMGVERGMIDPHIAQQYVEGEERFIQNYLHLENFATEIRDIEKKYNLLESPIPSIIKSHHHRTLKMTDMDKQTAQPGTKSLNEISPDYKDYYDNETIDLVKELFKRDFEKYGYNQNHLI